MPPDPSERSQRLAEVVCRGSLTITLGEIGPLQTAGMAQPDEPKKFERLDNSWAHLFQRGKDPRTPEERAECERREHARRKGRGRTDWWKKCPRSRRIR